MAMQMGTCVVIWGGGGKVVSAAIIFYLINYTLGNQTIHNFQAKKSETNITILMCQRSYISQTSSLKI